MHGVEQCLCAVALAAKDLDTHNCIAFAQAVPVPDKQPQGIRYGNFLGFDPASADCGAIFNRWDSCF